MKDCAANYDEANIDNLLVVQKDHIIHMINARAFSEAIVVLNVVSPMWESLGYGYKVKELYDRIAKERKC